MVSLKIFFLITGIFIIKPVFNTKCDISKIDFNLVVSGFNKFTDIRCNLTDPRYQNQLNFVRIVLIPKHLVVMTRFNFSYTASDLVLSNIKGFDISLTDHELFSNTLSLYYSSLDFFNGSQIINTECQQYQHRLLNKYVFNFSNILFLDGIKYSKKYCVIYFMNLNLNQIKFDSLTNTFLRVNYFEFISSNYSANRNNTSQVNLLNLYLYKVDVTKELLEESFLRIYPI